MTISEGYKDPRLNFTTSAKTFGEVEVDSEYALSYEGYSNSRLANRRLLLDTISTRKTVKNLQAFRWLPQTMETELLNVGEVKYWGTVLETAWIAIENLLSSLWLFSEETEYGDFVYDCYDGRTAAEGCTIDLSGDGVPDAQGLQDRPLAGIAKLRYVQAGRFDLKTGRLPANLYVWDKHRWQGGTRYLIDSNPYSIQKGYGILDLDSGIPHPKERWSAQLFIQYLLDILCVRPRSYVAAIGSAFHTLAHYYSGHNGVDVKFRLGSL